MWKDILPLLSYQQWCFTSVNYTLSPETTWGTQDTNGSFGGAIGYISRKEYEIFVTGGTISYERAQAIDFSEPTFVDSHSVLYGYPTIQPDYTRFFKPFTFESWMLILFGNIAFLSLILVFFKFKKREDGDITDCVYKAYRFSIATFLAQGFTGRDTFVRSFLLTWLPLALILQTVYRSNLKAMLTVQILKIPFNGVDDLLRHTGRPEVLVGELTAIDNMLKYAEPNSRFGNLDKVLQRFSFKDSRRVMENIDRNLNALVLNRASGDGIVHRDFSKRGYCTKSMMKGSFSPVTIAMMFSKNSTLKEKVNRVIVGFKEFGILDHMVREFLVNASKCVVRAHEFSTEMRPLVLEDFHGILILLVAGLSVSGTFFLLEMILVKAMLWNKEELI